MAIKPSPTTPSSSSAPLTIPFPPLPKLSGLSDEDNTALQHWHESLRTVLQPPVHLDYHCTQPKGRKVISISPTEIVRGIRVLGADLAAKAGLVVVHQGPVSGVKLPNRGDDQAQYLPDSQALLAAVKDGTKQHRQSERRSLALK